MPLSTFRRRAEPGQAPWSHCSPGVLAPLPESGQVGSCWSCYQLPTVGQEWGVGEGGTSERRGFKALLLSIMNGAYRVLWGGGGIPETG